MQIKKHNTYYDSELDTWVIDNRYIKKGEFDNNPDIVTVKSVEKIIESMFHDEFDPEELHYIIDQDYNKSSNRQGDLLKHIRKSLYTRLGLKNIKTGENNETT